MHKGWRDGTPGKVYSFTPAGALQPIMQHDTIGLPNGMVWDRQKRVMFFADTGAQQVDTCPSILLFPDSARAIALGGCR